MTKIAPSILVADPLRMFDAVKLMKDTDCIERCDRCPFI